MRKVIINLGKGDLVNGFEIVTVQILKFDNSSPIQCTGSLPPVPDLAESYKKWQDFYEAINQNQITRISILRSEGLRYSEAEFKKVCRELPQQLNKWLSSSEFRNIDRELRMELKRNEIIEVIIQTENPQLQRFPWHLWDFFNDYSQAEVAISPLKWRKVEINDKYRHKVKVLAIFGNTRGIDIQPDRQALSILPDTELVILEKPKIRELNEYLWDKSGWDIILFSGHSTSKNQEGILYLNDNENLTITQLKKALANSIANGLKIAIFNSCDGINLATLLSDLNIPGTIVMREPIPDKIAQTFLQYFLEALKDNNPFLLSLRQAREKLQGWEQEFPCGSWLPLAWQNPTIDFLTLYELQSVKKNIPQKNTSIKLAIVTSFISSTFIMLMRSFSLLQPLELASYDRLIKQRPPETIDPRILVVEITEEDTNRHNYPLKDETLVKAIDTLQKDKPIAIGLDLHRAYQRTSGYPDLIKRFQNNNNLFLVCSYGSKDNNYSPPKDITKDKMTYQMGFSDLAIDSSRKTQNSDRTDLDLETEVPTQNLMVRRQILSYSPNLATTPSSCITPYSFSFQLAFQYLQESNIQPLKVNDREQWQFGDTVLTEMSNPFGGYQNIQQKSSQIPINYRSQQPGQRVTLAQVLSGKIESQTIVDRLILIGYTAPVARDYFETPYGTMPGVWIHAHMTSQLISATIDKRPLIWTLPQWKSYQYGDLLWVFVWSSIGAIIAVTLIHRSFYLKFLGGIIILIVLSQTCLFIFIQGGWMPYIPTLISLSIVFVWIAFLNSRVKNIITGHLKYKKLKS